VNLKTCSTYQQIIFTDPGKARGFASNNQRFAFGKSLFRASPESKAVFPGNARLKKLANQEEY
jgi:hypothetical protein